MTTLILLPITRTNTIVLFSIYYYLFPGILGTKPLPTTYIRDTDGEPMLNGATYYILPQTTNRGGLTTVPPNTTSPCAFYISQESDPTSKGLPIKITSTISSKYLPFGSTVFSFPSDTTTPCTQPLVWRPVSDIATGNQYLVAGTAHQPVAAAPSGFSILEPFSYVQPWNYQISYCYEAVCGIVGIFQDNGLLGINNRGSVVVRFKKAFVGIPMLDRK